MITVLDLSFVVSNRATPKVLFDGVTAHFGPFERVGIFAAPGSGKTVLARLLCGMMPPDKGHVIHTGKVSRPLGYSRSLHPELTVRQNISIICRATGEDTDETILLCATLGQLEHLLHQPFKALTSKDKRALAFCISLAGHNDVYIADDALAFGEGAQKDAAAAILEKRLEAAGLIFLSHNASHLKKACDRYLVLRECRLEDCFDLEDAAADLGGVHDREFRRRSSLDGVMVKRSVI